MGIRVVSYLKEHVIPCLKGKEVFNTEDIWQYLYKGAYWKRGPVTMTAIGAVDMALWDLKAKALHVPLYKLLGGKSREKVLVYCHASGVDTEHALEDVLRHRELGYKAIRVQAAIPGIQEIYGVAKKGEKYEPASAGLPKETMWNTEKYLAFAPKLLAKIRNEVGEDIHLLHDVHHRLSPIEAARLGKELEPFHLFWLEDPVSEELQESFRLIRRHTTTPIAVGEIFNSVYDCHLLITEQLIDYLRMTVLHSGGITPILKIAHLAEIFNVRMGFHGATDLSPITMAASLHLDIALHNFGIQEHMPHDPLVDEVFPHAYTYADGYMYPGEDAGLGVDIDWDLAAKYPYRKAYLPVNRRDDGTIWNW